jgi:hypothetical protein
VALCYVEHFEKLPPVTAANLPAGKRREKNSCPTAPVGADDEGNNKNPNLLYSKQFETRQLEQIPYRFTNVFLTGSSSFLSNVM